MLRDICILSRISRKAKGWFAMANVLKADRQLAILNLLVEGNSIRSVNRLTGAHLQTILDLLVSFGADCQAFLDERLRGLRLRQIQCDEIWTFVAKKQSRLTIEERATRGDVGDVYLWTCLDRDTKLVATYAIGKRSADMARRLMMDLAGRLVMPSTRPHDTDAHAYQKERRIYVTDISTDGFPGYPEAVDLAFGPFVRYGVLIKEYRNSSMIYTPSEIVGTERRPIFGDLEAHEICTSHVERNNLTIRTFMKRFARLSLGFSKKLENLAAAVALHMAYYNFCWQPATLGGYNTPARAAGLTDRPWTFAELFERIQK
jgi:IS1 family transposase